MVMSWAMNRGSIFRWLLSEIIISYSIFHFFTKSFFLNQNILLDNVVDSFTIKISHRSFHSFSLLFLQTAATSRWKWIYSTEVSSWRRSKENLLFIPVSSVNFKHLLNVLLRILILKDVNVLVLCFVYLIKILHVILFHLQFLLRRTK